MKSLVVLLFLLIPCLAFGQIVTVVKVLDGDTIWVKPVDGEAYKCRLHGVDAPEIKHRGSKGQPFGGEAADFMSKLMLNKEAEVEWTGTSYDRKVCNITRKEDNVDVNLEMVKNGYAWVASSYLLKKYKVTYLAVQKEAQSNKKGLWSQKNPQAPWDYRKSLKTAKPKLP